MNRRKKLVLFLLILLAIAVAGSTGYILLKPSDIEITTFIPIPTPEPTPEPTVIPLPGGNIVTPTPTPEPTPTPMIFGSTYSRRGSGSGGGSSGGGGSTPTPTPTPTSEKPILLICDKLCVDCRDKGTTEPIFEIQGLTPGKNDTETIGLKNIGTKTGDAYIMFYDVDGELSDHLYFSIAGINKSLIELDGENIFLGNINIDVCLPVEIMWNLSIEPGNIVQGKTVSFDMKFELI